MFHALSKLITRQYSHFLNLHTEKQKGFAKSVRLNWYLQPALLSSQHSSIQKSHNGACLHSKLSRFCSQHTSNFCNLVYEKKKKRQQQNSSSQPSRIRIRLIFPLYTKEALQKSSETLTWVPSSLVGTTISACTADRLVLTTEKIDRRYARVFPEPVQRAK